MAVTSPACFRILMSACLSRGSVREKTIESECDVNFEMRSDSDRLKNSWPARTRAGKPGAGCVRACVRACYACACACACAHR
eukprot:2621232-Pleurochrysis_carterae.AAC.1